MMHKSQALFLGIVALALTPAASAQRWEFSGGGGASFYTSRTMSGPGGTADASFKPGYTFHGSVAQVGNRFGGAVRYGMSMNDMEIKSNRGLSSMGGRSQSIEYDFQYYFKNSEASVRPYLIGGGGVRFYTGTGSGVPIQPTMAVGVLTNTTQMTPVFSGGAGVRVQMSRRVFLRAEMRTSFTTSPDDVMTPTFGASVGSWLVNFVPSVAIGYEW
jgi:hypothetical protein